MLWQEFACKLQGFVAEVFGQKIQFFAESIDFGLPSKPLRQAVGTEFFNQPKRVFAVHRCHIESIAVDVFAGYRQAAEIGQHGAADFG